MRDLPAKPLLEVAPWLGETLRPDDFAKARRHLIVERREIEPGPWTWRGERPALGLLILNGRIARGLRLDDARAHGVEVLGQCDLLRPWTDSGEVSSIPSNVDWMVLAKLEVVVLDANYLAAIAHWPQLAVALVDLAIERTRTLSYFLTARQVARLEGRILLTLWHLADRWGHVSSEGVVLCLPKLTHEMIARMVAARRPSVTTSIRNLRELDVIEVRRGGTWVLKGDPVESLHLVNDKVVAPMPPEPQSLSPPMSAKSVLA